MSDRNSARFLFEGIFSKPLLSKFDSELRTSDGGASLLGAIDRKTKLTESLCSELVDPRDAKRIEHSYLDLFRQRVFSIALGYPDGNDAEQIGHDPIMKLVCGRKPTDKCALGSQPTLSRFEHAVTGREVVALGRKLEKLVIERVHHRNRHARLITIDLDGSVDPTHGQQPFAFFSGYYVSVRRAPPIEVLFALFEVMLVRMENFNPGPRPSDRTQLAEWYTALLNEQERSGLNVRQFAIRMRISIPSLYQWRRRLTAPEPAPDVSKPGLVEVKLGATSTIDRQSHAPIVLRLGGERSVEVPPEFNAAELKRLVRTGSSVCLHKSFRTD